jgi:hypothetical protein
MPLVQTPLMQSEAALHTLPTPHFWLHQPPQSVAASAPSLICARRKEVCVLVKIVGTD